MLLRVLVATDRRPLAERLIGIVTTFDVLARTVPIAGVLEQVQRDGYDLVMFGAETFAALEAPIQTLRELEPPPELLVLTQTRSVEGDAAALASGSLGVLGTDLGDEDLHVAFEAVLERVKTLREAFTELELQAEDIDDFVVASSAMRAVVDTAKRAARAASTVLIVGETGVGKERVAQLVHDSSPRADGPFIALNCAAIPSELVESELFGHERGAFTGAQKSRRGYFELAHGGTLFLDEIAELPAPAQAKLLRVLQDKQLRPIGADRLIPVDVRLIAATNRVLEQEIDAGRFRSDLYYRLRVVELEIPPLRERLADVERLLDAQLARFNALLGRGVEGFAPAARQALLGYAWPGNVRELINVIERAVLLCLGTQITLEDLPRPIVAARPALADGDASTPSSPASILELPGAWLHLPWREVREALLREGERAYLTNLLRATGGRIGVTAKQAGLAERSLFEKMKRHGLRKEDFR